MKYKTRLAILIVVLLAGIPEGLTQTGSPKTKQPTGPPGVIPSTTAPIHGTNLVSVATLHHKGQPYTGTAIWLHPNGKRSSQISYVNGIKEGQSMWWDESSQIKESLTYKAGHIDGVRTSWNSNKEKRSETLYKEGQRLTETSHHANGKVKSIGLFKEDKQDGDEKWFYESGEKMATIRYSGGLKDGIAVGWHENGLKKFEYVWQADKLVNKREWDSNGKETIPAKNPKKTALND